MLCILAAKWIMSTPPHVSPESARMTNAPYAGPSAHAGTPAGTPSHMPTAAASPRARPYIPPAWRSAGVAHRAGEAGQGDSGAQMTTAVDALPPIAEFLAADPTSWSESAQAQVATAPRDNVIDPEASDSYRVSPVAPDDPTPRGEDWPFADAGAATVELTGELRAPDPVSQQAPDGSASSPHAMWNDDDLVDIMPSPVQQSVSDAPWRPGGAVEAAGSDALVHESTAAGDVHHAAGNSHANNESAARALEALAHRVRSGELALPGYVPELGDAAALAAALAALLGIRRG